MIFINNSFTSIFPSLPPCNQRLSSLKKLYQLIKQKYILLGKQLYNLQQSQKQHRQRISIYLKLFSIQESFYKNKQNHDPSTIEKSWNE